jgi:hypothetical protein
MAIGRNFEEAIQKTIRMVHGKVNGFESGRVEATEDGLVNASYQRILVIADAFAKGSFLPPLASPCPFYYLCSLLLSPSPLHLHA